MKEINGDFELIKIYKERKKKMLELYAEGKSWEEAVKIVDSMDYEERIRKICPLPPPLKEPTIGSVHNYYEILDLLHNPAPMINGIKKYARLAIRLTGQTIYLGEGRFAHKVYNKKEK